MSCAGRLTRPDPIRWLKGQQLKLKLDGDYTCCEDDEDEEKLRPVFGAVKAGPENDDPNGEVEEEREIIFEQPLDFGGFDQQSFNRSKSVQVRGLQAMRF